jgi:hypothetical protein
VRGRGRGRRTDGLNLLDVKDAVVVKIVEMEATKVEPEGSVSEDGAKMAEKEARQARRKGKRAA